MATVNQTLDGTPLRCSEDLRMQVVVTEEKEVVEEGPDLREDKENGQTSCTNHHCNGSR